MRWSADGTWAETTGVVAFLLAVVSIPTVTAYTGWAKEQAMKDAWAITGPACRVAIRPPEPVFGSREPKVFEYGGVRFARRHGDVSCIAPTEGGPLKPETYRVCQFTAPAVVAVTTDRRTVVFKPGVGRPATVTIRGGEPSCVIGGWFGRR